MEKIRQEIRQELISALGWVKLTGQIERAWRVVIAQEDIMDVQESKSSKTRNGSQCSVNRTHRKGAE
jgi:hypothetical protein